MLFTDRKREEGMETPWGPAQQSTDLGCGVLSIITASHGGLYIPKEAAKLIPKRVRDSFGEAGSGTNDGGIWAEEDCEMTIAIAFLFDHLDQHALVLEWNEGVTSKEHWTSRATQTATEFPRYRPALGFLKKS